MAGRGPRPCCGTMGFIHMPRPSCPPASLTVPISQLPSWFLEGRFFLRLLVPFETRPWTLGRVPDPEESVTASSEKDLSRDVSSADSGAVSSSSSSSPGPVRGRWVLCPCSAASSGPSPVLSASARWTPHKASGSEASCCELSTPGGLLLENSRGFRVRSSPRVTGQTPSEGWAFGVSSGARKSMASTYQEERLSRAGGPSSSLDGWGLGVTASTRSQPCGSPAAVVSRFGSEAGWCVPWVGLLALAVDRKMCP